MYYVKVRAVGVRWAPRRPGKHTAAQRIASPYLHQRNVDGELPVALEELLGAVQRIYAPVVLVLLRSNSTEHTR